MLPFDANVARTQYLDALLARYGQLTLPLASVERAVPLHTVFQPLILRRDPSVLQAHTSSEVVTARNSSDALVRSEQPRIVILGGPGMGKTTALKDLLQQAISRAQRDIAAPLPLFISLPDLASSGLSLLAYIEKLVTASNVDERFMEIVVEAVTTGHAMLCLDSLDEVVPVLRPDVIALINREVVRYGGTWIIGSRFTEYKGGQFTHGQFAEWELQPLDEKMRLKLAEHLFPVLIQALAPSPTLTIPSASAFVALLKDDVHNATWGENPLLFSLAATIYVQSGTLPTSRALLYREIIEAMLTARLHEQEQRDHVRGILAQLALHLYQTKGRNFAVQDVLDFLVAVDVNSTASERYTMVAHVLDSGVLEVVASQTYGFKHQMFQEYLVASALASQLCSDDEGEKSAAWTLLWRKRLYSRWTEILRLLVGVLVQEYGAEGRQSALHWFTALANEQKTLTGDVGYLCLLLAISSLREFSLVIDEPLAVLASRLLVQWAEELIRAERAERDAYRQRLNSVREHIRVLPLNVAAPAFALLDATRHGWGDEETKVLLAAFGDADVTLEASDTVELVKHLVSIEPLLALLYDTQESWKVHRSVVVVLSKLGERTPLAVLREVFQNKSMSIEVREAALRGLGLHYERVEPKFFINALYDSIWSIRVAASWVLKTVDTSTVINELITFLHDKNSSVRANVIEILGQRADSFVRNIALQTVARQKKLVPATLFLEALHDEDVDVRVSAITILGTSYPEVPVEVFIGMLTSQDEHEAKIRCAALSALLQRDEPFLAKLPFSFLYDSCASPAIIKQFAEFLGVEKTIQTLLAMLNTIQTLLAMSNTYDKTERKNSEKYQSIVAILMQFYQHVPTESVIHLLNAPSTTHGKALGYGKLVAILLRKGVAVSTETLLKALELDGYYSNDEIISTFVDMQGRVPVEALLNQINSGLGQDTVYKILHGVYEWVMPITLVSACANTDSGKWRAVTLLGKVGGPSIISLLLQVAQNETYSRSVRIQTICALSDLSAKVPFDILVEAIRWDSYEVMPDIFAKIMEQLGQDAPIDKIFVLLNEDHKLLQLGACMALEKLTAFIPLSRVLALLENKEEIIFKAICILGAYKEQTPIDILLGIAHDVTKAPDIRGYALYAISKSEIPISLEALQPLLQDGSRSVRQSVLWNFTKIIPTEYIIKNLQANDYDIREDALATLRSIVEEGVDVPVNLLLRPLLEILEGDDYLSEEAAEVLSMLGEHAPVDALVANIYYSGTKDFREEIIRVLENLKEYAPLSILVEALNSPMQQVAAGVLKNLAEYLPAAILALIKDDIREPVQVVRIEASGHLPVEDVPVDDILNALRSEYEYVRISALRTLERLNPYIPVESVLPLLYDLDEYVRELALKTLAFYGERAPLDILLPYLGGENAPQAIETLQQTHPQALVALVPQAEAIMRGGPVTGVLTSLQQLHIANVLERMSRATSAHFALLTAMLDWPHWEVRVKAMRAFGSIRRNVPDAALHRLMTLRNDAPLLIERNAANDALAEILSLEQGLEDE